MTKKSGRGNIEIILNNYSSFSGNVKVIQKDNKDEEYNDKCDENWIHLFWYITCDIYYTYVYTKLIFWYI